MPDPVNGTGVSAAATPIRIKDLAPIIPSNINVSMVFGVDTVDETFNVSWGDLVDYLEANLAAPASNITFDPTQFAIYYPGVTPAPENVQDAIDFNLEKTAKAVLIEGDQDIYGGKRFHDSIFSVMNDGIGNIRIDGDLIRYDISGLGAGSFNRAMRMLGSVGDLGYIGFTTSDQTDETATEVIISAGSATSGIRSVINRATDRITHQTAGGTITIDGLNEKFIVPSDWLYSSTGGFGFELDSNGSAGGPFIFRIRENGDIVLAGSNTIINDVSPNAGVNIKANGSVNFTTDLDGVAHSIQLTTAGGLHCDTIGKGLNAQHLEGASFNMGNGATQGDMKQSDLVNFTFDELTIGAPVSGAAADGVCLHIGGDSGAQFQLAVQNTGALHFRDWDQGEWENWQIVFTSTVAVNVIEALVDELKVQLDSQLGTALDKTALMAVVNNAIPT